MRLVETDGRVGWVYSNMRIARLIRSNPPAVILELLIEFHPLTVGLVICSLTGRNHIALGSNIGRFRTPRRTQFICYSTQNIKEELSNESSQKDCSD